jgi:hypothetical protein
LNQKMLARLLALRPDAAVRLSDIGAAALRAYVGFFGECLEVANSVATQLRLQRISA